MEPVASKGAAAPDGHVVLVCEDESSVRRLICSILGREGYRILGASAPSEALRLAQELAEPVDLLVTDVIMPEINGKILADRMREQNPDLKVLFVSGYTADHFQSPPVSGGLPEVLMKPFSSKHLVERVREILD